MFLIFTLRREDIMPAGDLGVRKGVKILYSLSEMPSEKRVLEIAEKWRPYRTADPRGIFGNLRDDGGTGRI